MGISGEHGAPRGLEARKIARFHTHEGSSLQAIAQSTKKPSGSQHRRRRPLSYAGSRTIGHVPLIVSNRSTPREHASLAFCGEVAVAHSENLFTTPRSVGCALAHGGSNHRLRVLTSFDYWTHRTEWPAWYANEMIKIPFFIEPVWPRMAPFWFAAAALVGCCAQDPLDGPSAPRQSESCAPYDARLNAKLRNARIPEYMWLRAH
jgi:hypothetical protein